MKNITYFKQLNWIRIGLAAIIIIAFVFRFYNTPNRYGFDFDASRDALITSYGAQHLLFPPLGPASAIGFFHFGPWYYFFLIMFRLFFPFSYAPWILNSLLAIVSVYISYKIGEELFDKPFGFILALLVALSPAQIIASTGLSNPDFVILPTFLCIWIFIKLTKEQLFWWWSGVWGLVLGIGINIHFQMLTYLILPVIGIFFVRQNRLIYISSVFAGFAFAFIPWVLFDVSHHWVNTIGFLTYLRTGSSVYVPNSWTIYLKQFWPQFWAYVLGLPFIAGIILAFVSGVLIMVLGIQKKLPKAFLLLLLAFFIIFLYFRYYSGIREVYYTLFLHPFIFIFAALPFWYLYKLKKGMVIGSIIIIMVVMVVGMRASQEFHTMASHEKDAAILHSLTKKRIPVSKFYQCSQKDSPDVQAMVFLADTNHSLSKRGKSVGIFSNNCPAHMQYSALLPVSVSGSSIRLVILPAHIPSNWQLVTAKTVYVSAMNKWIR